MKPTKTNDVKSKEKSEKEQKDYPVQKVRFNGTLDEAIVKKAVKEINPDTSSMESRG